MAQVLAPRLECLWFGADFLPQYGQRVSEAVRIAVGQAGALECVLENLANGRRVAPVLPLKSAVLEMATLA